MCSRLHFASQRVSGATNVRIVFITFALPVGANVLKYNSDLVCQFVFMSGRHLPVAFPCLINLEVRSEISCFDLSRWRSLSDHIDSCSLFIQVLIGDLPNEFTYKV